MLAENINQEFRLKRIDGIRNYLIEVISQNKSMSKEHKKVFTVFTAFAFASLVGIPIGISSFTIGLKISIITAGIKKYKSMNKKKKKKHDKILLLAKSKLNRIEILISKALIDSNISHDEFVLINNVLKEFYDTKEEIKNSSNK